MTPSLEIKEVATGTALDPVVSQDLAEILGAFLDGDGDVWLEVRSIHKGQAARLPLPALKQLHALMKQLGQGHAVTLTPAPTHLTVAEMAAYLNVSLDHVVRLLDEGAIPSAGEGDQRRVPFPELHAYDLDWKRNRLAALDELTALSQELGMGY